MTSRQRTVYTAEMPKTVSFKDLSPGDAFLFAESQEIYVKSLDNDKFNAMQLSKGKMLAVFTDACIVPIQMLTAKVNP